MYIDINHPWLICANTDCSWSISFSWTVCIWHTLRFIIVTWITLWSKMLWRNKKTFESTPCSRDQMLAERRRKNARKSALHISSSYAKILGETNFHAREIPRSGWKVEGGEERKRKKKKKKKKVGENNGHFRFVRKHTWTNWIPIRNTFGEDWAAWNDVDPYTDFYVSFILVSKSILGWSLKYKD